MPAGAMSGSPSGLVARGRAQARSQRNGRRVLSAQAGKALQNPAYRPADADNEGFGQTRRTPRQFGRAYPGRQRLALQAPYPAFIAWVKDRGNSVNRALTCIRTATALAAAALAVAGCAAANNATSAQAQGEQPYRTMYGLTSDGPTTDLYTEFFGPREPPPAPATSVASVQPVTGQPMTPAQQAPQYQPARPGQAVATTAGRPNQAQTAAVAQSASVQPAPVQVAQQPAPPAPPPEPSAPVAYGISANGPTTDLYTAIFGSRHSDGQ